MDQNQWTTQLSTSMLEGICCSGKWGFSTGAGGSAFPWQGRGQLGVRDPHLRSAQLRGLPLNGFQPLPPVLRAPHRTGEDWRSSSDTRSAASQENRREARRGQGLRTAAGSSPRAHPNSPPWDTDVLPPGLEVSQAPGRALA